MQFTEKEYSEITQITLEIKFKMDRQYNTIHNNSLEHFKCFTNEYLNKKTIKELQFIVKKIGGYYLLTKYFYEHTKTYPSIQTEFTYLCDLISLRIISAYNTIKDEKCLTMVT